MSESAMLFRPSNPFGERYQTTKEGRVLFVVYSYPGATEPAVTRRGMLTRLTPSQLGSAKRVECYRFELANGIASTLFGPAKLLEEDFGKFRIELGHYYEVWN